MPLLCTQDATQCPKNDPLTTFGDILVALAPWTPSGSPLGSQVVSPGPLLTPMGYFGDHFCGLWGEGGKIRMVLAVVDGKQPEAVGVALIVRSNI